MPSSILVLGAGELGLAVLHSLSTRAAKLPSANPTITVLLRPSTISSPSPSKEREINRIRDLGIHVLPGDIATSSSSILASQFKPYDIVIGCTGFAGESGIQLKLAHAALEAKVKHYYPWQFGVDYDIIGPDAGNGLFREQCEVRKVLRGQQDVSWTILSTGMFTSFLLESFFGVVDLNPAEGQKMVVRALGSWENQVTITFPEDIGTAVAELIFGEAKTGIVFTAGDTVSYGQLADLLEQKWGKDRIDREVWSLGYLRDELERDPENPIKKYWVVFAEGRGVSWSKQRSLNVERGFKTTSLRSYLFSKT